MGTGCHSTAETEVPPEIAVGLGWPADCLQTRPPGVYSKGSSVAEIKDNGKSKEGCSSILGAEHVTVLFSVNKKYLRL